MTVRNAWVSVGMFAAMMHFLAPHPAAGQRLPMNHRFVSAEVRIPPADTLPNPGRDPLAGRFRDSSLAHTQYGLAADTARGRPKRDIVSHAVVGAITGGVVAYAVLPKSCDVSENMFCQPTLIVQHLLGAVIGGWTGAVVGVLREPR